jgi:muramoyltetrapeptide carboxypeptidase
LIRQNPKIISGASDITLLLNWIERSGVVAFHGPMVATSIRQGSAGYERDVMLSLLRGAARLRLPTDGTTILRPGSSEGRLTGGCLSLVVSTLGTGYEIDTTDSILVLEDIDAKPYQIDRMITQLKHARKFDSVRGVVFGEMLDCMQHPNQGYTLEQVLLDLLTEFSFPVLFGFATGHTSRPNVIVPFGVRARLDLTSAAALFELLEPSVT